MSRFAVPVLLAIAAACARSADRGADEGAGARDTAAFDPRWTMWPCS